VAACSGATGATVNGGERWLPSHGPDGGPALALAVAPSAPNVVYVGTGRGVFRSTNGGGSWAGAGLAQPLGPSGSSPHGVTSLVVDPRTPTTVYAGLDGRWLNGITYGQAMYKSTDGGHTWRALSRRGELVAIAPTGPPTVYAAAGGAGETSRLLRSTDGGRSWQAADGGLPRAYLWALAFDPSSPATAYAAMGAQGAFVSRNGGASWRALGISRGYGAITAVVVDARHPTTVYAGTDAGVIESLDGGSTWRMVNAALGGHGRDRGYMQVSALIVDPHDSRTLYASTSCTGVFKSLDGGRRWAPANAGLEPNCGSSYALAIDPRAPQAVYAADSARGVFKSIDGGARWHATNAGLSLSTVFSVTVGARRVPTVYAAAGALGLFTSRDGGAHWRSVAPTIKLVDDVATDPGNPDDVLAVVPGYGIVRSTDAGNTWIGARSGPPARGVHVVALTGRAAYAGTYGHGFFASADAGQTWRKLGALEVAYVQALATAPGNVVYAGSDGGRDNGLYKSSDGGKNWQRVNDAGVDAIVLDRKHPATLYVATSGGNAGALRSTDGGASWQRADAGLPRLRVRNRETGEYSRVADPLNALAIDPAHPATLYAAAYARGVYRSTNSGRSWQPLNTGLPALDVRTLALDATGRTLYAGTSGGGVVTFRAN
jgi:photosystem II stability/assembly factor-like uncharacterized protein